MSHRVEVVTGLLLGGTEMNSRHLGIGIIIVTVFAEGGEKLDFRSGEFNNLFQRCEKDLRYLLGIVDRMQNFIQGSGLFGAYLKNISGIGLLIYSDQYRRA